MGSCLRRSCAVAIGLVSLGAGVAAADGDARKALERYRRGVDALASERFVQAEADFEAATHDEAEREYRAALRADGSFGEAHNNLAVVLMMTGRLDEAQRHLDSAEAAGFAVDPRFKRDLAARRLRPSATSP